MLIINNQIFETGEIRGGVRNIRGAQRESLEITVLGKTHEDINTSFIDGAHIVIRQPEIQYDPETGAPILDGTGQPVTVSVDYDKVQYCVAGDIIDKRDGTFVVYMGTKTDAEKEREQKEQVMIELLVERGAIV